MTTDPIEQEVRGAVNAPHTEIDTNEGSPAVGIEDTTTRPNELHLIGAMSDGMSGYIEGMEAAGQRQLVASTQLPREIQRPDDEAAFEALGFTFGQPSDDLFREATLPEGWTKRGSDHAMWSYIDDERGVERVAIFYKAAFYDRSAFMRLVNVGPAVASKALYATDEWVIPWDLLTADETEQAIASIEVVARNERGYEDEARVAKAKALLDAYMDGGSSGS